LPDVQLILLCGDNDALADSLRALPTQAAHAVVAFTPDVRRYMDLADFFIGKPGPDCLSEAVHMGLPILTFENQWTPPRERFSAQWVRERGVGLVLNSVRSIRPGTIEMIGHLREFQARVRLIDNRAVFEVADILASLMRSACNPAQHFVHKTELAAA
jgi:UDP-N-acetylglucosamine:LPS N-acetylglucosamine transferase